jgi:hypothetical protein
MQLHVVWVGSGLRVRRREGTCVPALRAPRQHPIQGGHWPHPSWRALAGAPRLQPSRQLLRPAAAAVRTAGLTEPAGWHCGTRHAATTPACAAARRCVPCSREVLCGGLRSKPGEQQPILSGEQMAHVARTAVLRNSMFAQASERNGECPGPLEPACTAHAAWGGTGRRGGAAARLACLQRQAAGRRAFGCCYADAARLCMATHEGRSLRAVPSLQVPAWCGERGLRARTLTGLPPRGWLPSKIAAPPPPPASCDPRCAARGMHTYLPMCPPPLPPPAAAAAAPSVTAVVMVLRPFLTPGDGFLSVTTDYVRKAALPDEARESVVNRAAPAEDEANQVLLMMTG